MFSFRTSAVLAAAAMLCLQAAQAASPLVDVDWLKSRLGTPGIKILDVSSDAGAFAAGHIPGAIYTHYARDQWRVTGSKRGRKVAGVLPGAGHMAKLIGDLGIGNDDHVVVVPAGNSPADAGTAARVYWTFKVLGHEEVSILDGGNAAYRKNKSNPLEKGMSRPQPGEFQVRMNMRYLATEEDVHAAAGKGVTLLDSRPQSQFLGMNKSGKVMKAGTIPGAISAPGEWMTVNGGGTLRTEANLKKLYEMLGAPTSGETITFCNTGHWASLGWFVNSELLGNKATRMYDGSLAEYTTDPSVEVQRRIALD